MDFFFFFCFLGPHPWHMEVPRLRVESELQLLAYATATSDPSRICSLHHSSWQIQILNPLMEARDWACILMDTSQIRSAGQQRELPSIYLFIFSFFSAHSVACWVPGPGIKSNPELWPILQMWQCWILNPLCQAGDWTHCPCCCRDIVHPDAPQRELQE